MFCTTILPCATGPAWPCFHLDQLNYAQERRKKSQTVSWGFMALVFALGSNKDVCRSLFEVKGRGTQASVMARLAIIHQVFESGYTRKSAPYLP